jgi:hypothetical protein
VVTVPAAAMLGEVVSWTYRRTLALGELDGQRRAALEGLVAGASRLQEALTPEERESIVISIANDMFSGEDTRFSVAPAIVDDGPDANDIT